MKKKNTEEIDYKSLSKRYQTDIKKLVSAWKRGYNDMEVASMTGLEVPLLQQIKTDLELAHRKQRIEKKKNNSSAEKQPTFLKPYV